MAHKVMPVQSLLVLLANTPTPGWVYNHVENNLTLSYLCSWLTGIGERYLPMQYCMEIDGDRN